MPFLRLVLAHRLEAHALTLNAQERENVVRAFVDHVQTVRPLIGPVDVDQPVSRSGFEELAPGRFQNPRNRLCIDFKH